MKKLAVPLVVMVLLLSLSACIFPKDDDASCNTGVSQDVDYEGILYKTQCAEMGPSKVGLINTSFELVISELYMNIDRGFTLQHQGYENIEFEEEIEYFRTLYQDDTDFKQKVIDRKGQTVIEVEFPSDILISRNQEFVYLYNESAQIYHIQTKTYEPVDYRILQNMGDYFIAELDGSQVVLDQDFHIIDEKHYDRVIYASSTRLIYEKEKVIYSKDLQTNIQVELIDTITYRDYILHDGWTEYFIVNPNSKDVFFINSQTGEQTYIEECSRIVDYHQDTFSMICDESYQVFSKDTLMLELEIPKSNTEILDTYPIYFAYGEEETSLHSIEEKTITFDSAYESYSILDGDLLQVTTSESNLYIDLRTFEKIYQTDGLCMLVFNNYPTDFLFHQGDCNVFFSTDTLNVISLENSNLKEHFILEFKYYTEDLLFFLKDGKTVITDYELNILYE